MISQKIVIISALIGLLLLLTIGCNKEEGKKKWPPPTCKISYPTQGQMITKGDTITITIEVNKDTPVDEVEIYIDSIKKNLSRYDPYEYDWPSKFETSGMHTINARNIGIGYQVATDEITLELVPKPGATVANFSASPMYGNVPLTVNFTDLSSNNPTEWLWDFGDDWTSNHQNPSCIFYCEGFYTVSLIVENSIGLDMITKVDSIHVIGHNGTGEVCPGLPTIEWMGQTYNTVLIGDQCWFRENLNAGIQIDTGENQQNNSTIEKYCYENDPANCETFGGFYQWDEIMQYTTNESVQGICPDGWHIPAKEEWEELYYYLGGSCVAGGKMKVPGTEWWKDPNEGATNTSGFSALPMINSGPGAWFWSSTESNDHVRLYGLSYQTSKVYRPVTSKELAFSVRCLRD